MRILVTGAAGFIGCFTTIALLEQRHYVVGIDNLNEYYDVQLKHDRLKLIEDKGLQFKFIHCDLVDQVQIDSIFEKENFDVVVNLAAQAGVRFSIDNPRAFIESNVTGFANILEACRHNKIRSLIYASSSSVYGMNSSMPFSVTDNVDHPVSLYAATKKSNELLAHTYSHLYGIPTIGLRFFTVYGPWGRPDMAYFSFTKNILAGEAIKVFNHGDMERDFTYIDDIVEGIVRLVDKPAIPNTNWDSANPDASSSSAPYKIYNIGNNNPVRLGYFIECIEKALGLEAKKEYVAMQMGDVRATYADIDALVAAIDYQPSTPISSGIESFVEWYRQYYSV
ncbi:NAD-dependent epimerase [Pseudomonadales bacterium]|nr:NAD-dependent epimerase [Pseudomonadales bacterium]